MEADIIRTKMRFDIAMQNKWFAGGSIAGVHFSTGQTVRVLAGHHEGTVGKLTSLFDLKPEPVFHLETLDAGDIYVRQSEIEPVDSIRPALR